MRAMKLTWLTMALLAFGCEYEQREGGELGEQEGIQQLGEEEQQQDGMFGQDRQQQGQQQPGMRDDRGMQGDQQLGQQQRPGMEPGMQGEQPRDQQLGQQQQQPGQQQQYGTDTQQQPQQQTARGTVQSVDFAKGELKLQTDQEELTLKARPFDLGQVVQGDQIQVQYAEYGQEKWISPSPQAESNLQNYGGSTQLTGTIEQIDQQKGELTVKGQKVMVHPSQLQNLQQGQTVQLEYVTIEGQPWAANVQMGQEGMEQGT